MLNGESLKNVDDFLYLGSWIDCCSKDVNVRIGKAWSALHKIDTVRKSELSDGLKIGFFRATIETVLLYILDIDTVSRQKVGQGINKMMRVLENMTWWRRITHEVFGVGLSRILTTIRERCLRFSGHCWSTAVQNWARAHTKLCRLAYQRRADPDTLALTESKSMLSASCSPSLLSIKPRVFGSSFLCGCVFISELVWE